MTTIALIVIAVLLFELIILIHEGGHFVAAKKSGVKVNEFSLGMGPRLFGFTKGETKYSFRLLPIGGYCAMEGEDEESENPRAFNNAKIWKRMIIIIAGAVMNILIGFVFMLIVILPQNQFASTTISGFGLGSFSQASGLQQGDQIVSVNGYAVNTDKDFMFAMYTLPVQNVDGNELKIYKEDCSFDLYYHAQSSVTEETSDETRAEFGTILMQGQAEIAKTTTKKDAYAVYCQYYDMIDRAAGAEVTKDHPEIELRENRKRYRTDMTVIRNGERVELKDIDFMTLRSDDEDKPTLQLDFYVEPVEKNFGTVLSNTFTQTVSVVRIVWSSLVGLIRGQFSLNDMSGPVGIAAAITNVASESLETSGFGSAVISILYVMMIITVNLGIVNMLPFPALDGGRFLMLLIEAIFQKPVPRKVEAIINTVGLVLLLALMAVIAVQDVWKLFNGGFNYG